MAFPEVAKGMSYGSLSYKLNGKFFNSPAARTRSVEVSFDEREMLMEAEPETFFFTAHYKDYPSVPRADKDPSACSGNFLERRFREDRQEWTLKAWEAETLNCGLYFDTCRGGNSSFS